MTGDPTKDTGRQLSAFDAQFLAADTGNMHGHYCGLGVFGPHPETGPLTRDALIAHIESRLPHIPALRWRLRGTAWSLDHPVFVDGEVDVPAHVTYTTLPSPAGDEQLADEAARIMATRLPRDRPLWRFHFIDGLPDDRRAIGFAVHHAAADALSFATILAQLLDVEGIEPQLAAATAPAPEPTRAELVARGWLRTMSFPSRAVRAGVKAAPHLDQVPMMRTIPGARQVAGLTRRAARAAGTSDVLEPSYFDHTPRTRFNGGLTPERTVAFGTIDVDDVKAIKNHYGVTFNDVVVAAVGGGLRRRLQAGDELPEDPLVAFVPSNIRTTADEQSIKNAISSFIVAIPTDAAEPAQRIANAQAAMNEAKARHQDTPDTLLDDVNALIPAFAFSTFAGGVLKLMGSGLVEAPINLVLSNVPGPPLQLNLIGHPAETIYPLSLIFEGATLNITVVSYAGNLLIGIVGDGEGAPDVWDIAGDIKAEFAGLLESVPAATV